MKHRFSVTVYTDETDIHKVHRQVIDNLIGFVPSPQKRETVRIRSVSVGERDSEVE